MVPKIEFVWSWVYQQETHSSNVESEKYKYQVYDKYVLNFIKKLKREWKKYEEETLNYIEDVTKLKWKEKKIKGYVIKISTFPPFSDPLTIPIQFETSSKKIYTLDVNRYIDMLVHELIHNLFIQNEKEVKNYFEYILEKYKNEDFNTTIHLLLHAVHKKIFLKYFGKDRLKKEIEMGSFYPAYKRSWEIVNKKGEDSIIEEFKNYLDIKPRENA